MLTSQFERNDHLNLSPFIHHQSATSQRAILTTKSPRQKGKPNETDLSRHIGIPTLVTLFWIGLTTHVKIPRFAAGEPLTLFLFTFVA